MLRAQTVPITPSNVSQTLFAIRGANMAITTDQVLTKQAAFTNYLITGVIAVNKTGAFGVACLGGLYTSASKGGDALVAASQAWSGLTAAGLIVQATAANIIQKSESSTPILSLTTGNTGALTADIFVTGVILD